MNSTRGLVTKGWSKLREEHRYLYSSPSITRVGLVGHMARMTKEEVRTKRYHCVQKKKNTLNTGGASQTNILQGRVLDTDQWRDAMNVERTFQSHQLITSKEQNPSWEAKSSSAIQEIPRILRNPNVRYRIYKSPPPDPSWATSIQSTSPHPISWRSSLILSSNLRLCLPSGLFPSCFLNDLSSPLRVPHSPPISFFLTGPSE